MVEMKEAVKIALEHLNVFFDGKRVGEKLLEEVTLEENPACWRVTVGFDWNPTSGTASLGPGQRIYKSLDVDVETGRVIAVRRAHL